jgi:uncharacterized protein YqeY
MIEKISDLMKEAMKAKDKHRLNALRFMKAKLIENKVAKAPLAEMDVLIAHHKKLKEATLMYPEGHDQRNDIEAEIKVLEEFLPRPIGENEVKKLIAEIIGRLGKVPMGDVMKELTPHTKGRFDNKRASELVKEALQ